MSHKSAFWLVTSAAVLLVGCNSPSKGPIAARKIDVVTTTVMITDIVQIVGGERVEVTGLMGPGIDPHTFEPKHGDLAKMATADVTFYNGLHLEGQMAEIFKDRARRTRTVAVTDRLDPERDLR